MFFLKTEELNSFGSFLKAGAYFLWFFSCSVFRIMMTIVHSPPKKEQTMCFMVYPLKRTSFWNVLAVQEELKWSLLSFFSRANLFRSFFKIDTTFGKALYFPPALVLGQTFFSHTPSNSQTTYCWSNSVKLFWFLQTDHVSRTRAKAKKKGGKWKECFVKSEICPPPLLLLVRKKRTVNREAGRDTIRACSCLTVATQLRNRIWLVGWILSSPPSSIGHSDKWGGQLTYQSPDVTMPQLWKARGFSLLL